MTIVAFDPGGTTGVALWEGRGDPKCFELDGQHHRTLYNWLSKTCPSVVVYENFKWTSTPSALVAVEYIGVIKLYAQHRSGMPVKSQDPSYKQLWDDGKIKALGYWLPGKPHAMDALRHLLHYVTVEQRNTTFVTAYRLSAPSV